MRLFQIFSLALLATFSLPSWAAPASIDSNGDPTWLSYSAVQENQFKSPSVDRIVSVAKSANADFTKLSNKKIWTVSVVNARETIIGCYGFKDFLNPSYPTIFVLDQWTADPLYGLTNFVKSLTAADTLGAYLIVTDEHYGEVYSRKIAMDFIDTSTAGLNIKFDTIFAVNCDQHPVQSSFYMYKTLPQIAQTMYQTMKNETAWRAKGQTHIRNADVRVGYQVWAVIPVIFEKLQPTNNAISGWIHGNDVDGFSGTYHFKKPSSLGTYPWVVDTLGWPEGHVMLINYTLLHTISKEYFSMVQYLSEERILPVLLARHKMTVLRNNELCVLFDISTTAADLAKPVYNQITSGFKKDAMLLRNYEIITLARSPSRLNISFYDLISRPVNVKLSIMFGPAFDAQRIKAHWIPSNVEGSTLNTEVGRRFMKAQMMIAGYYEDMKNTNTHVRKYVMKRVFPTVYKVTFKYGYKFIGTLVQNGTQTKMYTNDWKTYTFNGKTECCTIPCLNPTTLTQRTITLSRGTYLQNMQSAYIVPDKVRPGSNIHYDAVHLVNMAAPLNWSYTISVKGGISTGIYDTQKTASP